MFIFKLKINISLQKAVINYLIIFFDIVLLKGKEFAEVIQW